MGELAKGKNQEGKKGGFRPRIWERISGQKQMKSSIHYSPEAKNDLYEIWECISFEWCNPQAAENTVNKIMDTVDELERFSEIGVPLSSVTDIDDFITNTVGTVLGYYIKCTFFFYKDVNETCTTSRAAVRYGLFAARRPFLSWRCSGSAKRWMSKG